MTINNPELVVRAAVDGLGIAYTSRLWPSHSCSRANWSACWRIGRPPLRDSFCIIRVAGKFQPLCALLST